MSASSTLLLSTRVSSCSTSAWIYKRCKTSANWTSWCIRTRKYKLMVMIGHYRSNKEYCTVLYHTMYRVLYYNSLYLIDSNSITIYHSGMYGMCMHAVCIERQDAKKEVHLPEWSLHESTSHLQRTHLIIHQAACLMRKCPSPTDSLRFGSPCSTGAKAVWFSPPKDSKWRHGGVVGGSSILV